MFPLAETFLASFTLDKLAKNPLFGVISLHGATGPYQNSFESGKFKANKGEKIVQVRGEGMAVKTVDRTYLQGQSVDLFRAAIKSQATRDPYERRLIGFLKKKDDMRSSDAFVEFEKGSLQLLKIEQWPFYHLNGQGLDSAGIKHPNGYVGTRTNSI